MDRCWSLGVAKSNRRVLTGRKKSIAHLRGLCPLRTQTGWQASCCGDSCKVAFIGGVHMEYVLPIILLATVLTTLWVVFLQVMDGCLRLYRRLKAPHVVTCPATGEPAA